jgi:uncharacterized protein YeaO (DUF488 family)
MAIALKRVYETPARSDGTRILVDRLWPRGLTKDKAAVDEWLRDLAPSHELRKWFHAQPRHWTAFREKYLEELSHPEAEVDLRKLYTLARKTKRLTLLFASKNNTRNNASVLKELLEGMRKPPSGTGSGALSSIRKRKTALRPR